ncbi:hypothetical protein Tco_0312866 [Tanacetum coccineum]
MAERTMEELLRTDISKIIRKQSKNGQARTRESGEYKKKPKIQSQSQKVKPQSNPVGNKLLIIWRNHDKRARATGAAHRYKINLKLPLVESEEDPESPQEILHESLELLARPQVASSPTCLQPPLQ